MVDFVELMQRKDVAACQSLVIDLKQKSLTDPSLWEQPVVSITQAVKQHYHHESLLAILKNLPFTIAETLYRHLIQTDASFPGIKTLVEHINGIALDKKTEIQSLIILLLSSISSLNEGSGAEYLPLKLSGKQQGELFTQLRKEADPTSRSPIAQAKYKIFNRLLSILTTHAFRDEAIKLDILGEDRTLATLLMSNLFERTDLNSNFQKKLVADVLQLHRYYNWEEPFFLNAVLPKLTQGLSQLTGKELNQHLKLYREVAKKSSKVAEHLVPLLDTIYSNTKDTKPITDCLGTGDDHLSLLIDFLTRSKSNESNLHQTCLKLIAANQLATFAGHFSALSRTRPELFKDYVIVLCNHLKSHPHAQHLNEELAKAICVFPAQEKQLAIQAIIEHLATPEKIQAWLNQLLLTDDNKTLIIPYCVNFIEKYPDKITLILTLVKQLNNADLLTLYFQMLIQGLNLSAYNFFKEFFKIPERQGALIHILTQTPAVNTELLNTLLEQLNNDTLMALLGELLITNEKNSEFRSTLDQVLLVFCERLYRSTTNEKIAQWHLEDNAKSIANALLDNPACIYQLSLPSQTWKSWAGLGSTLKYPIDAALNQDTLAPNRIQQIALNWLEYFRAHPEQLYTIFNNLKQSQANRCVIGEANFLEIKRACWNLLKPGTAFDDEELLKLLHAAKPELFDPLFHHLAEEQCIQRDPHRASIWLAKIKGSFPKTMDVERMVTILLHSVHDNNRVNWAKASEWLESCDAAKRLEFVRKVLAKVISSNNNPRLDFFFYEIITCCPHFNTFFPQLDESAWYWLFKNSNAKELNQKGAAWIELMSATPEFTKINLGKIIALFPNERALLMQIFSKLANKNLALLDALFLQLSNEPELSVPFDCLYELFTTQHKAGKNQFLQKVVTQLQPQGTNCNALGLMSRLITKHADDYVITANAHEPVSLISNYLNLLNLTINHSPANKQSPVLRQLQINLIQTFVFKDQQWSEQLTGLSAFTDTALLWLNAKDNEFLSTLLISAKALNIQAPLQANPLFQKLLMNLLAAPPAAMTNERFTILWNLLSIENKVHLARQIFEQEQLNSCHEQCLELIAEWMNPNALLQLQDRRPTAVHLNKALLTHPKGLSSLSSEERRRAFDAINNSAQLLGVLKSKSPINVRVDMVGELYNSLSQDLNKKLGHWMLNAETFAALANFTVDQAHQELLNKIISEKPHYHDYLNDYLQHSSQDVKLNEHSFLYHAAQFLLISSTSCQSELIGQLSLDDAFTVLNRQLAASTEPSGHFNKLLELFLKNERFVLTQKHHQWIIQTCLLSTASNTLDHEVLKKYLGSIEPAMLATLIKEFSIQAQKIARQEPNSTKATHVNSRLEQLIILGFSHHQDTQNPQRLSHLKSLHSSMPIPRLAFVSCLSSHAPFFSAQKDTFQEFVSLANTSMSKAQEIEDCVKGLGTVATAQMISAAMQDATGATALLQRLINSSCKEAVITELQKGLNLLIKQTSVSELNSEQLNALPVEHFNNALAMQRLIYFATPPKEFHSFINAKESAATIYEKQLFVADASLHLALSAKDRYSSWMAKNGTSHFATYSSIIEAIPDKETRYPYVQYSWLRWKSSTTSQALPNNNILTDGALNWLKKLNEIQVQNAPELHLLLKHLHDQKLVAHVFKQCVTKNLGLSPSQTAWLCENSLKINPKDRSNLPYIIKLSSWSWLESYMKNGGLLVFELLEFAVENPEFLKSIKATEESQTNFIERLAQSNFSLDQLFSLIRKTKDAQVRTLIITYVLSQKALLDNLQGESIINRLAIKEVNIPSRLNSLIHLMDVKFLTPSRIAGLQPEAAVSLLCSVPHFHLFTAELVESLLGVYPEKTVISYWTNHFSLMPNAHVAMAHLFKSANTHVIPILNAMNSTNKEAIVGKMIEHLELYHPLPKLLFEEHEENRLILALRLVQHGHHDKNYVVFINRMMDKLLNKNHAFSLTAIQLIIALNGKNEFSELNAKTAYLTNHYLRANAQKAETALFYNAGQLNMSAVNQVVQLNAPVPNQPSAARAALGTLIGLKTVTPTIQEATINIPEHPLINALKSQKKMVTAFDYFLIHFKGDKAVLKKILQDLIQQPIPPGTADPRRQPLDRLSALLIQKEMESVVREEIFAMLLQNPEFYDDQMRCSLLIHDAKRAIQHFGFKGGEQNYRQVISLCAGALRKLNSSKHATAIAIAKQAQSEAQLELTFHEERGFFANLLRRFKRCWISGWTGWFEPNLPIYVVPASSKRKQDPLKKPDAAQLKPTVHSTPDLLQLLREIKAALTVEKLDSMVAALKMFSLQAKPRDELEVRLSIHELYIRLLANRVQDKQLETWLNKSQEVFISNEFRLIELKLIKNSMGELQELTKETQNEHPLLSKSIAEFKVPLPLPKPVVVADKNETDANEIDMVTATVQSTVRLASDAWSWTSGNLKGFFDSVVPPNPLGTQTQAHAGPEQAL